MPPSEMADTHGYSRTQTHINTKQAKATSSLQSQPKNAQTFNCYAQTIQNIITKENL